MTKQSAMQSQRWLVMFQVPGSRWAYVATTTGSGSTMNPEDAFDFGSREAAEAHAAEIKGPRSSLFTKVVSRPKKTPAQLQREIDEVLSKPREAVTPSPAALETALTKAREKVAQSHHRQSIWMTRDGEFRVRPMFEKVSPLWTLVQHVPSDDELRG